MAIPLVLLAGTGAAAATAAYVKGWFGDTTGNAIPVEKDYFGSQTGVLATVQIVSLAGLAVVTLVAVTRLIKR